MSRADPAKRRRAWRAPAAMPGTFVLVVPGGGTGHPGAEEAVAQFMAAARSLAARGMATVYVGPGGRTQCPSPICIVSDRCRRTNWRELMRSAPADRRQRRLHTAAGHRLRHRLRRRSHCERSTRAHAPLRRRRRGASPPIVDSASIVQAAAAACCTTIRNARRSRGRAAAPGTRRRR